MIPAVVISTFMETVASVNEPTVSVHAGEGEEVSFPIYLFPFLSFKLELRINNRSFAQIFPAGCLKLPNFGLHDLTYTK